MKQKTVFQQVFWSLLLGSLILVTSCKKDEEKPVAKFTYTVDNLTVTFTNTSTNATSYTWDFGDSETSTEAAPTHTYADYGTFTVTLTAKGAGGEATATEDVELPFVEPIKIDGAFTDWASVPVLCSYPDGEGKTLLECKLMDSPSFLYVYIKGATDFGQVVQMYIDADNDSLTGWGYWNWYQAPGLDYMMEAVVEAWTGTDVSSSIQAATGPSDWPWQPLISANAINENSGIITSGSNKMIEFSILKAMFTTPALGSKIRITIGNSNSNWSNVGSLPPNQSGLPPATYTMVY